MIIRCFICKSEYDVYAQQIGNMTLYLCVDHCLESRNYFSKGGYYYSYNKAEMMAEARFMFARDDVKSGRVCSELPSYQEAYLNYNKVREVLGDTFVKWANAARKEHWKAHADKPRVTYPLI